MVGGGYTIDDRVGEQDCVLPGLNAALRGQRRRGTCTIKADHVKRESSLIVLRETLLALLAGGLEDRSGAEHRTLLFKGTSEGCFFFQLGYINFRLIQDWFTY